MVDLPVDLELHYMLTVTTLANDTFTGAMTVLRPIIKGQNVAQFLEIHAPPQIVEIVISLISICNYSAHKK